MIRVAEGVVRVLILALGVGLLAGCLATSPTMGRPASGEDSTGATAPCGPSAEELTDIASPCQTFLTPLASDITELVDPLENGRPLPIGGKPSGFGEVSIDTTAGCVNLLWKGELPDAVLRIIAKHQDVPLIVTQVPGSLIELSEAVDRIDQGIMRDQIFGPSVQLVWAEKDVTKNLVKLTVADHEHVATDEELRAAIEELAGVPMEVRVSRSAKDDDGIVPTGAGQNDRWHLSQNIAALFSSADEEVLKAGPPSFQYGVLGTTGDVGNGYVVYLGAGEPEEPVNAVLSRDLPGGSTANYSLVHSDVSISALSDAWMEINQREWLSDPTASYSQDLDPVLGKVVLEVDEQVTVADIERLRAIDPLLIAATTGAESLHRADVRSKSDDR